MQSIAAELDAHVAALFVRALEREFESAGFASYLHFRQPGGAHVREYRRGEELLTLKTHEPRGGHIGVLVESETLGVQPLVERAAGRTGADAIGALVKALDPALGAVVSTRLRKAMDDLLECGRE